MGKARPKLVVLGAGRFKKKKHFNYIVDSYSVRTKEYRYTVEELTEAEAKDLACDLMDCVVSMQNIMGMARQDIDDILGRHNFCTKY